MSQAELATVLKFVLDNEESLNENLELFLQKKGECFVYEGLTAMNHSGWLGWSHVTQNSMHCWHETLISSQALGRGQ